MLFYRQIFHSQVAGGGENLGIRKSWRDMDSAEEKEAHKQTGISCIKSSSENHFECTGNTVTAYLDGKYSGPDLLSENGGSKRFANGFSIQTTLGTASNEKSHCDSRLPSQWAE